MQLWIVVQNSSLKLFQQWFLNRTTAFLKTHAFLQIITNDINETIEDYFPLEKYLNPRK